MERKIPRKIFQTWRSKDVPIEIQNVIDAFKKNNDNYEYYLYYDNDIDCFIKEYYPLVIYDTYKKLRVGASKADFFRYLILYHYGGVYLDIDSDINGKLDELINTNDSFILSLEQNDYTNDYGFKRCYLQWCVISESRHPFLKSIIETIVFNIQNKRYINDVHMLTGPFIYSVCINECIKKNPYVSYRVNGFDHDGFFNFKIESSKLNSENVNTILYSNSMEKYWRVDSKNGIII